MANAYAEDIVGSLLSALECPICFEYVEPPISQCKNGHCICKQCLEQMLKECPLCKVDIQTPARSIIADMFVSEIMFPCKYTKDGCKEKMLLKDIISHHKKCGYFLVCDIGSCDWRGALSSLMRHVAEKHDGCCSKEEYTTLCFTLPVLPEAHVTIIEAHGKLFRSSITFDDAAATLCGHVLCLSPRIDETSFEYQYEFRSPSGEYNLIYHQEASHEEADSDGFLVAQDMMDHFYIEKKDKLLSCSVRIIKN